MHNTSSFIKLFSLLMIISACSTSKVKNAIPYIDGHELISYGRTIHHEEKGLELITPASHTGVSFTGKQCTIVGAAGWKEGYNFLQYELDGILQNKKLKFTSESPTSVIIEAPTDGKHTLWLYKMTEAHSGPIYILNIEALDIKPIKKDLKKSIEFIGNSITCGAAADFSDLPCNEGQYHDHHNAYLAYGPRTARALQCNFVLNSISGAGIYRNWNSDGPTVPQLYDFNDMGSKAKGIMDFSKHHPNLIVVALGTNDFSNGDGKKPRLPFDEAVFVKTYIDFLKKLKLLHPQATFVLTDSPMVRGSNSDTFNKCLSQIKTSIDQSYPKDKAISIFKYKEMTARGCSGHPSVEDHGIMSAQLTPFLKSLL
jgi:lysophospholipase L1-like esterase